MADKLLEGQYNSIKRTIRLCLKKAQKKEKGKYSDPDSLSTLITLAYLALLAKAFCNNSLNDKEKNEQAIDTMVDFILDGTFC